MTIHPSLSHFFRVRPLPRFRWTAMLSIALLTLPGFTILSCVNGGYDDVENPALALSIQNQQGQPEGLTEVRVYGRFHNPVQDSIPLLTRTASPSGKVTLSDTALISAMQAARVRGLPWPNQDSLEFNVVVSKAATETFAGNFFLTRTSVQDSMYRFRQGLEGGGVHYADNQGTLAATIALKPLIKDYQGNVGIIGQEVELKSIYIPGSPYWTVVDRNDGSFNMASIASGKYELHGIDGNGKVYAAAFTLDTDSTYAGSNWSEAALIWIER